MDVKRMHNNVIYMLVENYRFRLSVLNVSLNRVSFLTRAPLNRRRSVVGRDYKNNFTRFAERKKLHAVPSSVLIYVSPIKGFLQNLKLTHNGTLMYVHSDRYLPNEYSNPSFSANYEYLCHGSIKRT